MEDNDAQLQFKKRARRRLVGAVFFASVVAVVLPLVMDHEPRQQVQEVEIRIPGQDEKPFAPKFASPVAVPEPAQASVQAAPPPVVTQPPAPARVQEAGSDNKATEKKPAEKGGEKPAVDKPADKKPAKPEKTPEKAAEKPVMAKTAEKPVVDASRNDDAKRAAAILAGQGESKAGAKGGEFLVLIGAFSNEDNVRHLKAKLGEQGVKTFSEPLDTPQGRKIRLRAGPFPSREAADKALDKMKRIGVSGVVAAKP